MGKIILLITVLLFGASCTKSETETKKCYRCELTDIFFNKSVREVCTNRIDTMYFVDANNNSMQSACVEK